MPFGFGFALGFGAGGVLFDTDAAAALAARTTPATSADSNRMNALVQALKGEPGLWAAITYLSVGAVESAQAARINIKTPTQIGTEAGSTPSFTAGHGYNIGINCRIDTGIALNALLAANSAFLGFYTETDGQSTAPLTDNANTTVRATLRNTSDQVGWRMNAAGGALASLLSYDARGLLLCQRTSSATIQYYKNGVKFGADAASTSVAVATDNFIIGLAAAGDTRTVNAVVAGNVPLTASQNAALNTALVNYFATTSVYTDYWPFKYPMTATASVAMPDIPGYSAAGKGFTCTGLFTLGGGQLLVGDDGRYGVSTDTYDATNWRPKVHVISTAGALVSTVDIYTLEGLGAVSASSIQGVCLNAAGHYAVARLTRNKVIFVNPVGPAISGSFDFAHDGGPNGLAYDSLRGIWYVSGINAVATIYKVASDGTELGTITVPADGGISTIDHLHYDPVDDVLWITSGENGSVGVVRSMALSTLALVRRYYPLSSNAMEGACRVGTDMYLANDAYFHVGGGVNRLQKYTIP